MQCPKCQGELARKTYGRKIAVHRCVQCMGLFAKRDVLTQMKKEWMAEILDKGDPKLGKRYDAVADIKCPECGSTMAKVSDAKQSHIWYESCPNCDGVFFDAGEFTDWKHDTLLDRFRDLFRGKREA